MKYWIAEYPTVAEAEVVADDYSEAYKDDSDRQVSVVVTPGEPGAKVWANPTPDWDSEEAPGA